MKALILSILYGYIASQNMVLSFLFTGDKSHDRFDRSL